MIDRFLRWSLLVVVLALGCGSSQPAKPTRPAARRVPSANAPVEVPASAVSSVATAPFPQPVAGISKEPGKANGPCPEPSAEVKRIFANALALADKTAAFEPHRAMAEAIRMRLDELYQHGCYRHLDDDHLLTEVARIAEDPKTFASNLAVQNLGERGIYTLYNTGFDAWVALYHWHEGKIRSSMIMTGEGTQDEKRLLTLGHAVFQIPGVSGTFVALANTHPWTSSCWRAMRFRIAKPGQNPFQPEVLMDLPTGGRWCEGVKVEAKGDTVHFTWDNWGGPWSRALVQRPYTNSYQYKEGKFEERFGFPPRFEDLVEDWLMRRWALAQEATIDEARSRLKAVHDELHQRIVLYENSKASGDDSEYTREVFPVSDAERRVAFYCAKGETGKRCSQWPRPVDFYIERSGGLWRVKDVKPRK